MAVSVNKTLTVAEYLAAVVEGLTWALEAADADGRSLAEVTITPVLVQGPGRIGINAVADGIAGRQA